MKAPAYMKGSSPLPWPVKRAPWAWKNAVITVMAQARAAKRVAKPITSNPEHQDFREDREAQAGRRADAEGIREAPGAFGEVGELAPAVQRQQRHGEPHAEHEQGEVWADGQETELNETKHEVSPWLPATGSIRRLKGLGRLFGRLSTPLEPGRLYSLPRVVTPRTEVEAAAIPLVQPG
jgi:hypothetical protein